MSAFAALSKRAQHGAVVEALPGELTLLRHSCKSVRPMTTGSTSPQASRRDAAGPDLEEAVVAEVRRALRTIQFGSVLIKIHQGEVVGIETSTKVRLRGGEQP